jgi:hypothetical protein
MNELELALGHWQSLAELQVEYLEALGEAKLRVAKAEVAQAVAAEHWAVARMKMTLARELQSTLLRLRQQRHRTRRRIQRLGRHAHAAAKIRSGEDLPASQLNLMWGGYTVFERLTPVSVIEELSNIPLHPEARRGASYAAAESNRPCPDPPAEVSNVLGLISWLRRHRLVPRRGTHAYRQVVSAFARIASVAETQTEQLRSALRALEEDTFETWQPAVIAALPDNVDVKKLLSLGAK